MTQRLGPVTLSAGIIQPGPTHCDEPEEMIRQADALMYPAKKICKNGKSQ